MGRLTKVITEFRKTFDSLLFSKQKFSKNYPDAKKTSDIPGWADSNEGRSLKLVKHILKDVSGDDVMAVIQVLFPKDCENIGKSLKEFFH